MSDNIEPEEHGETTPEHASFAPERDQQPVSRKDKGRVVQTQLDDAMKVLERARAERMERGCMGALGATGSCLVMLVSVGVVSCAFEQSLLGAAALAASAVGFVTSMRFIQSRAPVQQEAEEKIAEIARRIRGDEILRLGEAESTNLHKLLYDAGPDLAKAILAILALAGDRRSLKVAETMSNRTGEAYLFAAGSYESVRQEAARAAAKLRERIELARRSSTLLRPSSSTAEQELLRPEPSPGGGTPEGLLRPAPDRVED